MKKLFVTLVFSMVLAGVASAQSGSGTAGDPFYGTISSSVTWDLNTFPGGTIYIGKAGTPATTYNDLTINTGGHLTIGPGITLTFMVTTSDLIITASGILTAAGTSISPVTFTKSGSISHWGHVSFEIPGSATAITGTGSFSYCTVEYGYAATSGTNPDNAGGGIQVNASNVTITNCLFRNNYSNFGGAVTVNNGRNTILRNCYFKSNSANEAGGALLLWTSSTALVENCVFEQNYSKGTSSSLYSGGAIWLLSNSSVIVNTTFVKNTSDRAGDAVFSYGSASSKIINSIFWGSNDQYAKNGTAGTIAYCAFESIKPANAVNSIVLNSNNSAADGPNFIATDGSDWSLKYVSPCRDAGVNSYTGVTIPALDYTGMGRVKTTDMGAYEVRYSLWTGASGTDWATASNWFANVDPSSGTGDVILPSALSNYPVSSTTQDFTIGSGKLLMVDQGARLTLNNLTNNGTLKLNSTSAGFASLILNGYTRGAGGTEEIQMFLLGGGTATPLTYKWHYISSPVSSLAVSTFAPSVTLDLAQWIESYPSLSLSQGWVAFDGYIYSTGGMGGPTFSTLNPGQGYDYYKNSDYTFTFGGMLNTGDVTVNLNYTAGNPSLHGYNLLGNPFSSGLDWDYITNNGFPANTSKSIYFTRNSTLCSYINGIGTPGDVTGIIPPMQAFFNKTSSAGNSIVLAAAARTNGSIHPIYKSLAVIPLVRLSLTDDTYTDETVIRFDDLAQPGLDDDFDAPKLFLSPDLTSIYTSTGGTNYAINGQPFPDPPLELPVTLNLTTDAPTKSITATQLQGLDGYDVTLTDNSTGFVADLKTNPVLTFAAPAGNVAGRFILKIGTITTGIENPHTAAGQFNIYPVNNRINIQTLSDDWDGRMGAVRILDLTGKAVLESPDTEFHKNSPSQVAAPSKNGIYVVEIKSGLLRYVGKVIIK